MKAGGWRFARWGMTAEEIVAASEGRARKIEADEREEQSGDDFTTLAVAEVVIGPFEFDVSFRAPHDGTTLTTVRLELRDAEHYADLLGSLTAEYGAGEELPREPDRECVRWRTAAAAVVLKRFTWPMDLGVDVVVDYEPTDSSPAEE
jgi:hypothetical protein